MSTQIIYTAKNAAPPFDSTSAGKRQTLPNPTADPTVAAMMPIFDLNNDFFAKTNKKLSEVDLFADVIKPLPE